MPQKTNCGGFADILSINIPEPDVDIKGPYGAEESEGVSEVEMQKLLKKIDRIMMETRQNGRYGLIAILLSVVILISSIIIGIVTISSVNEYKEFVSEQVDEDKDKSKDENADEKEEATTASVEGGNATSMYGLIIDAANKVAGT